MSAQKFVVGRGKVYISGRYIGNTPEVRILDPGTIFVRCENMSDENIDMILAGPLSNVDFSYRSSNPVGGKTDFAIRSSQISFDALDLKGDQFMSFGFTVRGDVERV